MTSRSLTTVLAAGLGPLAKKDVTGTAVDSRGGGWFSVVREYVGGAFQSMVQIDAPRDVLAFSGVFACTTMIAGDISKMRLKLVKENKDGTCTEVEEFSAFKRVLEKPNSFQNRIKFLQCWIVSKLIYGNVYALKQRDGRGMVVSLYILDPQRCKPLVTDSGDVYYQVSSDNLAGVQKSITVPASEIIHDLMVPLWHPLVGVSPIYACGLSATMGNRIQRNSTKFFENASMPAGILVAPGRLDDDVGAELKRQWDQNYSGNNRGKVAVLGNGLKFEKLGAVPAQEAQLIEQLKWTIEDVARCYHMPLYKVGGPIPQNATVENLGLEYYTGTLQVLIEELELALEEGLGLPEGMAVELDLDGLLRMDTASMVTAEAEAIKAGIKKPNESRRRLNLAPVTGGDTPYLQQQNFSLAALDKRDKLPNPFIIDRPTTNPTPSAAGPPATGDPSAPPAKDLDVSDLTEARAALRKYLLLAETVE